MTQVFANDFVLADQYNDLLPLFARKTADETITNSTLQNDDHLLLSVAASTTYELTGVLHYFAAATPKFKFAWTFPTGLTMKYTVQATAAAVFQGYTQDQTTIPTIDGIGVDVAAELRGLVFVSSTAGTLRLQWAQGTTNATGTILRANSYIALREVA